MIRGKKDITDREFKKYYEPFYDNLNDYLNKYIIPEVIAFYLANSHYRHCLCDSKLYNHINSALLLFNCECDIKEITPIIEEILKIKYNLMIKNTNPLR